MSDLILKDLYEARVMAEEYPVLSTLGIQWLGFTQVTGDRTRYSVESERIYTAIQITVSGCAEGLVDGRWQPLPRHTAYVIVQGASWAWRYKNTNNKPWVSIYVRMLPSFNAPISCDHNSAFIIKKRDPSDLIWVFQRLHRESLSKGRPPIIRSLCEMAAFHARELINEGVHINTLYPLWTSVLNDLQRNWDLPSLCRIASMSREKLRTQCRDETGRTPMAHVTYLRMRRAMEMLCSNTLSIHEISCLVGYENQFNFSRAFKNLYGSSPSEYRSRQIGS